MDHETVPFQWQPRVSGAREKKGDYIAARRWKRCGPRSRPGGPRFSMVMVGMKIGGKPIDDYAPRFLAGVRRERR